VPPDKCRLDPKILNPCAKQRILTSTAGGVNGDVTEAERWRGPGNWACQRPIGSEGWCCTEPERECEHRW